MSIFSKNRVASVSFFNEPLKKEIINVLQSYDEIIFSDDFNQSISFIENSKEYSFIPDNIVEITFGQEFNYSVDNLPKKLRVLQFGKNFNQPINNLPKTVEILVLGWFFNQPIDNLPQNLKILVIGCKFNHPLDFLPDGLEDLKILSFNYSYDLLNLPNTLKRLFIPFFYNGKINVPIGCEIYRV